MAAPLITWWDNSNSTQLSRWEIGVIDAGSTSPEKEFLIWNNRMGDSTTVISDAINCVLTTKDVGGLNGVGTTAEELITGKWVNVCCLSAGKDPNVLSDWTPVGGATTQEVRAGGSSASTEGLLAGGTNDGTIGGAEANFIRVKAKVIVPNTALAGRVDYLLRLMYQYV